MATEYVFDQFELYPLKCCGSATVLPRWLRFSAPVATASAAFEGDEGDSVNGLRTLR
jgi:hypothetical protein